MTFTSFVASCWWLLFSFFLSFCELWISYCECNVFACDFSSFHLTWSTCFWPKWSACMTMTVGGAADIWNFSHEDSNVIVFWHFFFSLFYDLSLSLSATLLFISLAIIRIYLSFICSFGAIATFDESVQNAIPYEAKQATKLRTNNPNTKWRVNEESNSLLHLT